MPLVPLSVRRGLRFRRRLGAPVMLLASAGLLVTGTGFAARALWLHGHALRYATETAPAGGGHRLRFSDGSDVTGESGARLQVVATARRGAHLRLEEGGAHLHVAAHTRSDWSVEAGPYALAMPGGELDVSWSAGDTSLSVMVLSGATTVRGPFAQREALRLRAGETLVARAADGFWRVGRGHQPSEGRDPVARAEALGLSAPAGMPSRLGAADSLTRGLLGEGRCRERSGLVRRDDPANDPWISVEHGCLAYGRDGHGNRLPDFSQTGYRGGGVPLPFVPREAGQALLLPGATGDDTPAIQAAIDAVSARPVDGNGFRGVVELGSGTFTLRGSLRVMASGVVLRGQGSDAAHGTILRGVGAARPVVIFGSDDERTVIPPAHRIVDAYVPVGARTVELDSTEGLRIDDDILVQRPFSQRWLGLIGMDRVAPGREGRAVSWRAGSGISFERKIVAIEGNRVTLDVPLTNALERELTEATVSKYSFPQRIDHVGFERIAGRADFDPRSDLGDGLLVEMNAVANGWVREVKAEGYENGVVSLETTSKLITVADVAYATSPEAPGWARAFQLGGQQNLIIRARASGAHHALVTVARTPGPNAVVDLTAVGRGPIVAPNRWTAGLLLDNVRLVDAAGEPTGEISMRAHGGGRGGGGWSAANCVVWNSEAGRLAVDNPPTAQNWVIGAAASETFGSASFDLSRAQRPDSLYRAQLAERFGESTAAALAR